MFQNLTKIIHKEILYICSGQGGNISFSCKRSILFGHYRLLDLGLLLIQLSPNFRIDMHLY